MLSLCLHLGNIIHALFVLLEAHTGDPCSHARSTSSTTESTDVHLCLGDEIITFLLRLLLCSDLLIHLAILSTHIVDLELDIAPLVDTQKRAENSEPVHRKELDNIPPRMLLLWSKCCRTRIRGEKSWADVANFFSQTVDMRGERGGKRVSVGTGYAIYMGSLRFRKRQESKRIKKRAKRGAQVGSQSK